MTNLRISFLAFHDMYLSSIYPMFNFLFWGCIVVTETSIKELNFRNYIYKYRKSFWELRR